MPACIRIGFPAPLSTRASRVGLSMQETFMDHGWRHHAKRGGLPRRGGAVRPSGENADMARKNNFTTKNKNILMLSYTHSPSPHSAPPGLSSNSNLTIEHSFIAGPGSF